MLEGGQIEPSDSPWASHVVLVTKKDDSTRFCVDYRQLIAAMVPLASYGWFNAAPGPPTVILYDGLGQQMLAVAMSPDASRKSAFVTYEGLFQFSSFPDFTMHRQPSRGLWTGSCPACVGRVV